MAVDAILYNDKETSLPQSLRLTIKLLALFPMNVQHFFRDRIMREFEFTNEVF